MTISLTIKLSPLPRRKRVRERVAPTIKSFLLLLLILFPSGAVCQTPQDITRYTEAFGEEKTFAQGFYQKAMERQTDPQWTMEVLGRAKLMRDQGLPTQNYFLKASEGLTKRVPPTKILPALNKTQTQTESASHLVDDAISRGALVPSPQAKREAILNYQRALLNDVPPSTIQKLSDRLTDPRSKIRIDQLGQSVREFPKFKKGSLSEDEAFGKVEKKLKEKGIAEKRPEAVEKASPEKIREEKETKKSWDEHGEKEKNHKIEKGKEWKNPEKVREKESEKHEKNQWKEMKPGKGPSSPPSEGHAFKNSSGGQGHGKGK